MSHIARVKFTQYVVPPGPAKHTHRTDTIEGKAFELALGEFGVTAKRGPHSALFPWDRVLQVVFEEEAPPAPSPPVKKPSASKKEAKPRPPFQPKVVGGAK